MAVAARASCSSDVLPSSRRTGAETGCPGPRAQSSGRAGRRGRAHPGRPFSEIALFLTPTTKRTEKRSAMQRQPMLWWKKRGKSCAKHQTSSFRPPRVHRWLSMTILLQQQQESKVRTWVTWLCKNQITGSPGGSPIKMTWFIVLQLMYYKL